LQTGSESADLGLLPPDLVADVNNERVFMLKQRGKEFDRKWNSTTRMRAGDSFQQGHRYAEAVEEYQKALFLTSEDSDRAFLFNNIGYALTCLGDYQLSLSSFAQALKLDPEFAYALDNMGYAHLMLGDFDKARAYLKKASNTPGNHPGYTMRNVAILHWLEGDMDAAGKEFTNALSEYGDVDLLEFHYARYLLEVGERQAAIQFAEISAEKGEPAGLDLMKTLKA
jgi:tetratricopeptide (TPR) repeat protein